MDNNNKSHKRKFSECLKKRAKESARKSAETNKGSACKALPPDFTTQAALLYNKASEYCNNKQIYICTFVGKYIYLIYSSAYSLYFI